MADQTETQETTLIRLRRLAEHELEERFAAGGIEATAMDGSLSSGRVWPSSDLDLTVVPTDGPEWTVRWSVREGVMVHTHINRWPLLERLRDGYPQSFVDTAAGDWVRDPTWLLDGLAALRPVHDPGSRLERFREFMQGHRFQPEVVEPRRPLLLRRAGSWREEAATVEEPEQAYHIIRLATETLSLIWLEAAGRIISTKEMDPQLKEVGVELGQPGMHSLMQAAGGVGGLESSVASIERAFRNLFDLYQSWLDPIVESSTGSGTSADQDLAEMVYYKHRLWSALYAPTHRCYLHLASVREDVARFDSDWLKERAAVVGEGANTLAAGAYEAARQATLDAFPIAPIAGRLEACRQLEHETAKTFGLK